MNNGQTIYDLLAPAPPAPVKTAGEVCRDIWNETYMPKGDAVAAWEAAAVAVRESMTDEELEDEIALRQAKRILPSYERLVAMAQPKAMPTEEDVRAAGCDLGQWFRGWYIVTRDSSRWLRSDGTWSDWYGDPLTDHPTRESALEAWGRRKS